MNGLARDLSLVALGIVCGLLLDVVMPRLREWRIERRMRREVDSFTAAVRPWLPVPELQRRLRDLNARIRVAEETGVPRAQRPVTDLAWWTALFAERPDVYDWQEDYEFMRPTADEIRERQARVDEARFEADA